MCNHGFVEGLVEDGRQAVAEDVGCNKAMDN
jgi:hypothetical protein